MRRNAMTENLPPITPGEVLFEEFLEPLGVSQNKLARDIDVPVGRINDIIHDRRGISADTAIRLGAYFGTTAEFWSNLQVRHDLKRAKATLQPVLSEVIRPLRAEQ
jgi:addiction module HigA family antidote